MAAFIDCYAVLGVSENASDTEIKTAYHCGLKRYHPDLHPNDKNATEKTKEVIYAYEVLSDSDKRANFNQQLREYNSRFSYSSTSRQSSNTFNDLWNLGSDLRREGTNRNDFNRRSMAGDEHKYEKKTLREQFEKIVRYHILNRETLKIKDFLNQYSAEFDVNDICMFRDVFRNIVIELAHQEYMLQRHDILLINGYLMIMLNEKADADINKYK